MKTGITIGLILLSVIPVVSWKKEKPVAAAVLKWAIEPQSTLQIDGKSNINTFECGVKEFLHTDTLVYVNDGAQFPAKLKGSVVIDINRFDCGHRYITADLRKTLKADENPALKIRFLTMEKLTPGLNNQKVSGTVEIELAGVTRQYEIKYVLQQSNNTLLLLTGNKIITFGDFKLKPPSRLAGLIKVAEEITVNFQLYLKPV